MLSRFHGLKQTHTKKIVKYLKEKLRLNCDIKALFVEEIKDEQKKVQKQKWLDTKHTAEVFGVHVCTINRWKHAGYLTARTIGGRDFFSIDEINHVMTKQTA